MKTLSLTVTIVTLLLLAGCATKQVSHTNSPTKELAPIKTQKLNEPTLENFLKLQEQILQGNIQAVDNIAELSGLLYADIDYKKDEERVRSNLDIMRATFTPIGIQAGSGNTFAYDALLYALEIPKLKGAATYAIGDAAATGHQPAQDLLLNYQDHNLLLSSTVGSMRKLGVHMKPETVDFLIKVNKERKGLSHMSAVALKEAAIAGNKRAELGLKELSETGEKYSSKYYDELLSEQVSGNQ